MIRIPTALGRFLAALAILLSAAASAHAAVAIKEVTSPGGVRAWLVEEHSVPMVSVVVSFRGGAAEDPEDREGLSYFLSGMLDEGAGGLNSRAFQERIEDLSIRLSFDADRDSFDVSLDSLSENAPEAFRMMGLALKSPRFDAEPLKRVRRQIHAILTQSEENPQKLASNSWRRQIFGSHPYGRAIEGTKAGISAIKAKDLRDLARRRFVRSPMIVAVVGDISAPRLAALLDETFGPLPPSGERIAVDDVEFHEMPGLTVIRRPMPQSTVVFGHSGIKRDHPDWYVAYVMNHILGGGGFTSRLTDEVREKRGLAYSVYSYLDPMDRAGIFAGGVATENARVGESIDLIRAELTRMRDRGVTEAELNDAKTYLTGSFPLSFDTSRKIASQLAFIQREGLGIDYLDRRNGLIEAVTTAEIRRVAAEILRPDGLVWTVVGDPANLESAGSGAAK